MQIHLHTLPIWWPHLPGVWHSATPSTRHHALMSPVPSALGWGLGSRPGLLGCGVTGGGLSPREGEAGPPHSSCPVSGDRGLGALQGHPCQAPSLNQLRLTGYEHVGAVLAPEPPIPIRHPRFLATGQMWTEMTPMVVRRDGALAGVRRAVPGVSALPPT